MIAGVQAQPVVHRVRRDAVEGDVGPVGEIDRHRDTGDPNRLAAVGLAGDSGGRGSALLEGDARRVRPAAQVDHVPCGRVAVRSGQTAGRGIGQRRRADTFSPRRGPGRTDPVCWSGSRNATVDSCGGETRVVAVAICGRGVVAAAICAGAVVAAAICGCAVVMAAATRCEEKGGHENEESPNELKKRYIRSQSCCVHLTPPSVSPQNSPPSISACQSSTVRQSGLRK